MKGSKFQLELEFDGTKETVQGRIQTEIESRMTLEMARRGDGGPKPSTFELILREAIRRFSISGFVLRPLGTDAQYFHAGRLISQRGVDAGNSPYVREFSYGSMSDSHFGETASMKVAYKMGAQLEHVSIFRTASGSTLRLKKWSPIDKPDQITHQELYFKTDGEVLDGIFHRRKEYRLGVPLAWPNSKIDSIVAALGKFADQTRGVPISETPPAPTEKFTNERWGLNFSWLEQPEGYARRLKEGQETTATRLGKVTLEHARGSAGSILQMALDVEPEHFDFVRAQTRNLTAFFDHFKHYHYGTIDLRSKHEQLQP